MSKELLVSSTRHETRVAVLEDDQVVEIYYQRDKEYSLAGSIHKGRVTRVLPGMQSAFVDIGLERDAFLYVSDFFEDNDEYDKVVTSVEEKVLQLEKGVGTAGPGPVAVTASAVTESPEGEEVAVLATAQPVAVTNGQPVPISKPERSEDRDRRGHRSRRRRPKGGGRGIPESKYFSPRAARPAAQPLEAAAVADESNDDFAVLPGESLAKYGAERAPETHAQPRAIEAEEPAEQTRPEEPEAVDHTEINTARREEPEITFQPSVSAVDEVAYRAEEPPQEPAAETAGSDPASEERSEAEEEGAEMPAALALDDSVKSDAVSEADDDEPGENAAAGDGEGQQAEGAEPARIPTSLTATLREQGPRFQHRMSRRMRRKMRASGPAPAEGQRAPNVRELKAPEARVEVKAEAPRPAPRPDRSGPPSISDLLREGQEIIVQIAKEPLGQKGARITSHIALPGRFLVYMPTVDHIGVSRKIPSEEERTRLKRVLQANRTGIPGGYIVRTAGDGRTEEELRADMMFLYNLWLDLRQKAEKRAAPALVHHDLDVVQRILRDQLTSAFKTILVDNEEVYESVLSFVQRFQPALVSRVKLYTRSNPIFDEFGITAELEKALRPKVWLKSGGYIVINQTEALVAIDINTGKFVGKSNRLEDTIVKTNTDAIREIVRQIRLRDLGGIIVVDFIDMDERKNRQKVMQALEEAMRADRAPYKILQFNDFGLVAITRKRVKQSLERTLCAPCPYCEGAGYVKNVQTVIGEILQEAHKMAGVLDKGDVTLRVNPEVAKTLKSNKNDFMQEIEEILGRTVLVKSDPQMHQQKFDLA